MRHHSSITSIAYDHGRLLGAREERPEVLLRAVVSLIADPTFLTMHPIQVLRHICTDDPDVQGGQVPRVVHWRRFGGF